MKYDTETFIKKSKKIHGDKYDYSKIEYKNSKTKVCIICPEHGEFWQIPDSHLRGCGCWVCSGKKRQSASPKTTEEWIEEAKAIHGDKYDYSKVEYVNSHTKVCIICSEHGEFWQYANHHLQGKGCPICGRIKRDNSCRKTLEEIKNQCKKIHGEKYNIISNNYTGIGDKILVECEVHGCFETTANRLLQGHGCPKCVGLNKTTEEWIEEAKAIHGDKYDYSKVQYINSQTKVCIICPKHGEFWQLPTHHLQNRGCPHCKQSQLEKEVMNFLLEEKIKFIPQKRSKWLGKQSLDFYLPEYNIAIECQGKQHFVSSEYFGGEKRYKKTVELDKNKNKICSERGIKILYYTHYSYKYDFDLITDLITLKNKIYGFTSL